MYIYPQLSEIKMTFEHDLRIMECISDEDTNVSCNDNVLGCDEQNIYTGDTNGSGTFAHPPGVTEFTLGYSEICCAQYSIFCTVFCRQLLSFYPFSFLQF